MSNFSIDIINISFAVILVFINGFFVAAEFALVKVRPNRIDEQVGKKVPFAATARWLTHWKSGAPVHPASRLICRFPLPGKPEIDLYCPTRNPIHRIKRQQVISVNECPFYLKMLKCGIQRL